MKRVLTIGLHYTGKLIEGVEIENLGLCQPSIAQQEAAFPLYEYDTIIIYPKSFTHFIFGKAGEFSDSSNELGELKKQNNNHDYDSVFDYSDRMNELDAALKEGATVIWCMSECKRINFFGYRENYDGYLSPKVKKLMKRAELLVKKSRRVGTIDPDSPFIQYFDKLSETGWTLCLSEQDLEGYTSIASTPEEYSLGGKISLGTTSGWLITPPTSQGAENQLIIDSLSLQKDNPKLEKYHGIFLSHTGVDKPFVRRLRQDLLDHGVPRVWIDEAEIEIGDSLIAKIEEGLQSTRYIGVVLSAKSVNAPWVKKELEIAINREIAGGEVVVLPLLYEKCDLPPFLQGKLYADFTDPDTYDEMFSRLLKRLRIR